MKDKILLIIFLINIFAFPKFLIAEDKCKEWFQKLNLKEDPNCGLKCATASTDMGTWDCVLRCDELCPRKPMDYSECEEIRNPGLLQKLSKWPKNPINILFSYLAKESALRKSEELFPDFSAHGKNCNPRHNGHGDAFRHCYWVCNMTKDIGIGSALDYSDWYEFYKPGPCDEAQMDYNNNRVGVKIAQAGGNCETDCLNSSDLLILKENGECR